MFFTVHINSIEISNFPNSLPPLLNTLQYFSYTSLIFLLYFLKTFDFSEIFHKFLWNCSEISFRFSLHFSWTFPEFSFKFSKNFRQINNPQPSLLELPQNFFRIWFGYFCNIPQISVTFSSKLPHIFYIHT